MYVYMHVCIFPRKKKGITGLKINMQRELSAIRWSANNRGYYILGYYYKECCNDISDKFFRDGTYDLNCFIYDCRLKINPRLAVAKIDSQRQSCFGRCDRMLLHYRF